MRAFRFVYVSRPHRLVRVVSNDHVEMNAENGVPLRAMHEFSESVR